MASPPVLDLAVIVLPITVDPNPMGRRTSGADVFETAVIGSFVVVNLRFGAIEMARHTPSIS
jgi:hypothetical protein